jgi:putative nucleotidyltransferase with HDIG domain
MHEYIIQKLCENGCKAYLTGGAVRDLFLGIEPNDYDVVTEAIPEQVETFFSDQKVSVVGKSFEVCLINGIEIAGYRKDTYFGLSDKNCEIEPAETLEEDLGRRDFTINAMAFCPYTGELIDPYNGMIDVERKVIKFVGNPKDRIYEDPCRIIRACRFLAKINGSFDEETFQSLKEYAYFVRDYVAPERIRLEILKAMDTKKASLFFLSLDSIGALEYIFPSLAACFIDGGPYHAEDVFAHSMVVGDSIGTKCPLTKLAGYLHDIGKPEAAAEDGSFIGHEKVGSELAEKELKRLKFSNEEVDYISNLISLHMLNINNAKGRGIRRAISKLHSRSIPYGEWLRLKFADTTGNLKKGSYSLNHKKSLVRKIESEFFKERPAFSVKDLEISGHDVMNTLNLSPGKEVGNILKYLYDIVLFYPQANNRNTLINLLLTRKVLHGFNSTGVGQEATHYTT